MPTLKTLDDIFEHEIKDLYSVEKQLLEALPKMAQRQPPLLYSELLKDIYKKQKA
jgi:ferritin-like metal-binding protein YciE